MSTFTRNINIYGVLGEVFYRWLHDSRPQIADSRAQSSPDLRQQLSMHKQNNYYRLDLSLTCVSNSSIYSITYFNVLAGTENFLNVGGDISSAHSLRIRASDISCHNTAKLNGRYALNKLHAFAHVLAKVADVVHFEQWQLLGFTHLQRLVENK